MVWLLDKLHIVRGVYLLSSSGFILRSCITKYPFATKEDSITSWVYPFARVGYVILLPDGTVQQPHYLKQWRYMRER